MLDLKNLPENAREFVENQLSLPNGLILLTGINDSCIPEALASFAQHSLDCGRKVFGLHTNGVWSTDEVSINWPKSCDHTLVSSGKGMSYVQEIGRLKNCGAPVVAIDQIRDLETARAVVDFSQTSLVITSLRGGDAFSAYERMLDLGVERKTLFANLLLVIGLSRGPSRSVSYEVIGHWPR